MKTLSILPLLFVSALAANVQAATIIDSATRNGSFEDPTATGSQLSADFWSFGFNSTKFERNDNDANTPDGDYALVVGFGPSSGGREGAFQLTDYVVAAGDTFSLSFDWGAAFNWNTADKLSWRIFTTGDDTTSGTISEIASGFVTGKSASSLPLNNWTTEDVLINGGTIAGASIGQRLYVEFYEAGNTTTNGDNQFARLDSVVLSVTSSIPEPSSFALIAGGLALCSVMVRRRHSA